ncbi:carbohydrate ABC transporter permease [Anaerocolumna sp. MB42-C2]|uniref:carbohydrate ABC transporter permease n=1 Tax=Anaerocolumna sp. MB42-C2 TaxID=3070997 RepID=UPI0027DF1117|nr:carbohydrate ABC transporter permease [Anaerocolumna sp. MB42-C2]WMJ87699.1 carbohydrate ABC transporter permease [Anaerocolumna sp. MB42-C2]
MILNKLIKKIPVFIFLAPASLLIILPLWVVIFGSFMGNAEIAGNLAPILSDGAGNIKWTLIPQYPTLRPYVELLLDSPAFFVRFQNSLCQVCPLLVGQLFIAVPAAWAFSRFEFLMKKLLFIFYMAFMIMPFQVTMVSNYLVLDRLKLLDTNLAIILPGMFSTFPVFIMTKFFTSIPVSLLEASELDGANEWQIFIHIGIPMGMSGIVSSCILGFLENWNAIEPALTFLSDQSLWPLSLYLPEIAVDKAGVSLAASVIMITPPLLVFFYGQSYLEQGICASGLKE